jgi:hypothetical protein
MQRPYKPGLRIIEDCPINWSENERGRLCTQLPDPHLPRPGAGWVSRPLFTPSHIPPFLDLRLKPSVARP